MTLLITPDWPAPPNVLAGTTTRAATDRVLPRGLLYPNQMHGATVVPVARLRESDGPVDADAVTGRSPGDRCAVRTADCLPILFCARDGSEIAAAHGGWRGVLAGVVENTVAALDANAANLLVWLGPAISRSAFEVGEEVREAFVAADSRATACFEPNARGRWQADLCLLARQRLHMCGISTVYGGHWCTYRDAETFWSYRRDAAAARMVSFIRLR
ncbi:MAG: peptidoglycan editing factor PgeF [Proteobacteria bacterium]|nr:peptidoglycan editing factor PgeF [Pseudomonadota bacterium]